MGALNNKLYDRQSDVLQWIAEGCLPREWPDATYKTTAIALQNRALVLVSKRGGVWSATLTERGQSLVGAGHADVTKVPHAGPFSSPTSAPKAKVSGGSEVERTHSARRLGSGKTAAKQTPSRELVQEIVKAGGTLRISIEDAPSKYVSLVASINSRGMAPMDTGL